MKRETNIQRTRQRRAGRSVRTGLVTLLGAAALVLLITACYSPVESNNDGLVLDLQMNSKGPSGDETVLAGFVISAEFEDSLKDATQLMVGMDAEDNSKMEDKFEDIMLDLALGGTVKFGENPYFAMEVPYDSVNGEADFTIHGIPSGRDYLLYMGGFESLEEVQQFFGLVEEEADYNEENIPYSHLFYIYGQEDVGEQTVSVPFDVSGVSASSDFLINTAGKYEGPGWYLVQPWGQNYTSTIIRSADQPFSVKKGKESTVNLILQDDSVLPN
jgi:hypothetical protein